MMEINVGQRLKERRERLGVAQREIARRSGQSPGAVSAIEVGKVSPSVETLKRLLDCLDISLADFFAPEGSSPSSAFFGPDDMIGVPIGADPLPAGPKGRQERTPAVHACRGAARVGYRQCG